jgi:hypothetical protein
MSHIQPPNILAYSLQMAVGLSKEFMAEQKLLQNEHQTAMKMLFQVITV